jgi:hypothetical protein
MANENAGKKVLSEKEELKFRKIQKRIWKATFTQEKCYEQLEKMGLEFDIYGKPTNFVFSSDIKKQEGASPSSSKKEVA